MPRIVARLYESIQDGTKTVRDLESAGFRATDITLIMANSADPQNYYPTDDAQLVDHEKAAAVAIRSTIGKVADDTSVDLVAALRESGVGEEDAIAYADIIRHGGAHVSIRVSEDRAEAVAAIMEQNRNNSPMARREFFADNDERTGSDPGNRPYREADAHHDRSY